MFSEKLNVEFFSFLKVFKIVSLLGLHFKQGISGHTRFSSKTKLGLFKKYPSLTTPPLSVIIHSLLLFKCNI